MRPLSYDRRIQFLGGDRPRQDAPIGVVVWCPHQPEPQRLRYLLPPVGHPIGNAAGAVLPGELSQHDRQQQHRQGIALASPVPPVGPRR